MLDPFQNRPIAIDRFIIDSREEKIGEVLYTTLYKYSNYYRNHKIIFIQTRLLPTAIELRCSAHYPYYRTIVPINIIINMNMNMNINKLMISKQLPFQHRISHL